MTAEHESADGVAYDGMDALMAAITGDPVPEDARRDAAFRAEHRAAEADVAVLKEQLTWLAEALTGETQALAEESQAPAAETDAPAPEAEQAAPPSRAERPAAGRPRSVTRPAGPSRPRRPGRPPGPRRALRIALGSLAGAAALSLAAGFGWLVTHSAGDGMMSGGADDRGAKSAAGASAEASGDTASGDTSAEAPGYAGRPSDPELALACSRLVVEGTVAGVEPGEPSPGSRVTLTVIRSYKPAHGPAEVSFLLDGAAEPAPRKGQHVLVRVRQGQENASLWAVGDTRVAEGRAWITEALPASRHTTCPSDEAP
ncbi:hypothetical protein ABZ079_00255 [Streptomyces sp. NPDC006314]|uniref:hypothetical protein n=1 Tax=Streptomyces sp. NPDC006314 TaxID=3154475 RepID=UPI0033A4033C